MERFVVIVLFVRNRFKIVLYVIFLDRVTEFGGELYEDGGKFFCIFCNVVLNYVRKFVISDYFKLKIYIKRKVEFEE